MAPTAVPASPSALLIPPPASAYGANAFLSEIPIQDDVVDASGEAADTITDAVADALGVG